MELHLLHPTLVEVCQDFQELWRGLVGPIRLPVITEVWRSHQETVALYLAAGRNPPRYSVHETRPCRGLDWSSRAHDGYQAPMEVCRRIEQKLNLRWRYHAAGRYNVCHAHTLAGLAGLHFHLQVRPGDETQRRQPGPWAFGLRR